MTYENITLYRQLESISNNIDQSKELRSKSEHFQIKNKSESWYQKNENIMHFFVFQTIFFLTENFGELKNRENMSYFILLKIGKKILEILENSQAYSLPPEQVNLRRKEI